MKRFKITMMVPSHHEVVVVDEREAHTEAMRLISKDADGTPVEILKSIELVGEVQTEEIQFPSSID